MRPEPVRLLFVSVSFFAVVSIIMQSSAGLRVFSFSRRSASTPATQGVAIDVPLFKL